MFELMDSHSEEAVIKVIGVGGGGVAQQGAGAEGRAEAGHPPALPRTRRLLRHPRPPLRPRHQESIDHPRGKGQARNQAQPSARSRHRSRWYALGVRQLERPGTDLKRLLT